MTIYKTIGTGYFNTVIAPCITESVKIVTAQYSAEALVSSRRIRGWRAYSVRIMSRSAVPPWQPWTSRSR